MSVNCKTMSGLFDTYVSSILYYSCEVWGFNKGTEVEKLHLEFCKRLLGVKKSTCNIRGGHIKIFLLKTIDALVFLWPN